MQFVAQCRVSVLPFGDGFVRVLGGGAEAGDPGDVLGTGTHPVFLAAAVDHRPYGDAVADVERADAFRSAELVPGHGEQVHVQFVDGERDFADGLGGVGVKQRTGLMGEGGEFGDGLDRAGLVVGVHHGHQQRVGRERCLQVGRVDQTVGVDRQDGDADALSGKGLTGLQDGRVFGGLGDHLPGPASGQAGEGKGVGFAAAAGEDDFRRRRA